MSSVLIRTLRFFGCHFFIGEKASTGSGGGATQIPVSPAGGTATGAITEEGKPSSLVRLVNRGFLRNLLLVAALLVARMNWTLLPAGIALFLLGATLHFWSKACLMRNFMVTRQGPYRFVRHPFYLANLLIDLGICLIAGNPYLILFYVPLFLLAYIPTIRGEERFLTNAHGDQYRDYMRQIPMLISWRLDRLWGPWDGTWTTVWRENEVTRLSRILAIPFYILLADALYHHRLTGRLSIPLAVISALLAVAINLLSVYAKGWARRKLMED
jgi:protein-S-isoprenylcysteine O-methyltransferase Ste14